MHPYLATERVVKSHPIMGHLVRDLLASTPTPPKSDSEFLKANSFFIYPRTFYLRWNAETEKELGAREQFDAHLTSSSLNKWLKSTNLNGIVLDLRGVTILNSDLVVDFFRRLRTGFQRAFCLCEENRRGFFSSQLDLAPNAIFTTEEALTQHLRDQNQLIIHELRFREKLDQAALEDVLATNHTNFQNCDAVRFDLTGVHTIDFTALSLLSPVIHSLAHEFGTLASLVNMSKAVSEDINLYGVVGVMKDYLLCDSLHLAGAGIPSSKRLPMLPFSRGEFPAVQAQGEEFFYEFCKAHYQWFYEAAGTTQWSTTARLEKFAVAFRSFLGLVKELTENAAYHSAGLGYLMVSFDEISGLRIYVGDTGVGLARGIQRRYKLNVKSDEHALELAFQLHPIYTARRKELKSFGSGGRGLARVRAILSKLSGELTIRTGTASGRYHPSSPSMATEIKGDLCHIQGTHVHISIPNRKATSYAH
jgi:ABC-type transporter Mla MlaB component